MMRHENFACFILTHGRADRVHTYSVLRNQGYTGRIYLIVDNEDEQIGEYKTRYADEVIVFDKEQYLNVSDTADTEGTRSIVLPARNACHDIAATLGLDYFLELDDDYTAIFYRYPQGEQLKSERFSNLDEVFDSMLDFLDVSGAVTVAFSQGGDLLGGVNNSTFYEGLKRKAMNAFFCRTDRPFKFYGRINEDTTMNVVLGSRGKLMFTVMAAQLVQKRTQSNAGGLTDAYLDMGTYRKSFYSVMYCPSAVKISTMGETHKRIHHHIDWNKCVPKIISPKYRK